MPTSTTQPTPPFPLYLLPIVPFRRRRSSATTVSTTSPSTSPPQPTSFLTAQPTTHLRCHKCLTDLVPTSSIISKGFTGRYGRAYLVGPPAPTAPPSSLLHFNNPFTSNRRRDSAGYGSGWKNGDLPNTLMGKPQPRQLVTGAHTVSDISCATCGIVLGWKYVEASEESQRYKVGKYILETKRVVKSSGWEDGAGGVDDVGEGGVIDASEVHGGMDEDDVEFDSQDDDECEDLFSGIWSPGLARKRRKTKFSGR